MTKEMMMKTYKADLLIDRFAKFTGTAPITEDVSGKGRSGNNERAGYRSANCLVCAVSSIGSLSKPRKLDSLRYGFRRPGFQTSRSALFCKSVNWQNFY